MTPSRRLVALLSALILVPLTVVAALGSSASAADQSAFTPLRGFTLGKSADVRVRPSSYRAYRVDLGALRAQLGAGGTAAVTIPDPAGTPTEFRVVEDSVMEPALQAAHPEIRTYKGADAQGNSIRLDVTPMGFHAFVRRTDGVSWLVDPAYNRRGETTVLSYAGGSTKGQQSFVERELDRTVSSVKTTATTPRAPGDLVTQRTYRMAFVTDPSYAAYFGTANVAAEKATMMNRVNEVYNDDLAVKFVLVAGTDLLNLDTAAKATQPNGPCGVSACYTTAQLSNCNGSLLDRQPFVTGMIIGADNFDIGHIGLGNDGGGVAGLGVVGTADKSVGCTGLPTPDGDLYAIDYVAHEVGHQMGGNHTFNGNQGSCGGGNRNGATSVEPGSGSSVMAYAGICGSDNLQPHSDPYFSQRSVDEIRDTIDSAPGNENEVQQVSFNGLTAGEQITLSCDGCGSQNVTFSGVAATDALALANAINSVTGSLPVITGYDGAATVNANGFTARWTGGVDVKRLTVTGPFTAIVGVIVNGGPQDNGGTASVTTNHSPVITAVPAARTIPTRTPFALTGAATDADGDVLTYMWEQNDRGAAATGLTNQTKTTGPLFRQFGTAAQVSEDDTVEYHSPGENLAGTDPTRVFPDMEQVLAGNTNAATGACATTGQALVDCLSEFLPTSVYVGAAADRALNFRFTARDEFTADAAADHPGGLSTGDVKLTVDPNAGPFLVTSRATAGTATGFEDVTWAVNNTQGLAPNVKISLSTDGGLTFPTVLADSTPNDGAQTVILPSVSTSAARIKVEAVDNYFFAVNGADFSITPSSGDLTPRVDAGPDGSVKVGGTFTSAGSFADETPESATATVDYGDGSGPQALALSGTSFTLSHVYTTPGTRTVTVTVTDAGGNKGTDTATVTVSDSLATSAVKASAKPKKVVKGKAFRVKVKVTASAGTATGTVQVFKGKKLLGTGTLKNGKVTIKVSAKKAKKLKVGKNKLTASYAGSTTVAGSQATFTVKVVKKKK